MKKLLAIGLATCLPAALAAEDPAEVSNIFGTVNVLVIEDSVPAATDLACARAAIGAQGDRGDCAAVHRAVLTARIQKASALHERGRWL
jgi:D-alanyl-D-alanine dipeptidase